MPNGTSFSPDCAYYRNLHPFFAYKVLFDYYYLVDVEVFMKTSKLLEILLQPFIDRKYFYDFRIFRF